MDVTETTEESAAQMRMVTLPMARSLHLTGRCVPLLAAAVVAACNGESPLVDPPPTTRPIEVPTTPADAIASIQLSSGGTRQFSVLIGTPRSLNVTAFDSQGQEVVLPSAPGFLSRRPELISVSASGLATAHAAGIARIVATLQLPSGNLVRDSLDVGALCSTEKRVYANPSSLVVEVGKTVQGSASVKTCGGLEPLDDTIVWSTFTTTVLSVDPQTGVITGRIPGTGSVIAHGSLYPQWPAQVTVTVIPPTQ